MQADNKKIIKKFVSADAHLVVSFLTNLDNELQETQEKVARLEEREKEHIGENKQLLLALDDLKKTVGALTQTNANLRAENEELARSLNETRARREEFAADARNAEIELRLKLADAERVADRWRVALDAALNDVAIYRCAAFWFGLTALAAVVVAVAF